MDGEANNERWGWGLSASAIVHALVAALIIFGLPSLPQLPQEEVVSVTLEPPPEKPPEPAKAAPKPPPPPAEPAKEPPQPAQEQAAAAPIPTFNPVVKFGEKDAGPHQSLAGAGAKDNPDPPTRSAAPDEPKPQDEATPEKPDEDKKTPAAETEKTEAREQAKATENTGGAANQLVATTAVAPEKAAPPAPPKPKKTKAAPEPKLQEARTLFSRSASGGPAATTAMANIPRGIRAGRLCVTELRLQLLNGASPYPPDLLPSYELKGGTVLKVRRSAFRAGGMWHNLSFECQVDADATSVRSFALRVGDPLSRDEAMRRGLPLQ